MLFRFSPFQNETIAGFVLRARLETFRQLSPRTDWVVTAAASLRFTLTAAHRVVDRVHNHAAHVWTPALPARAASLTARDVHVIDVADLTNRRVGPVVDPADFARRQFDESVATFTVAQRRLLARAARDLSAAARREFDAMDVCA